MRSENKPLPAVHQSPLKSEVNLRNVSGKPHIINALPENNQDTAKPQISDKVPVSVDKSAGQESVKEALNEILPASVKADAVYAKPALSDYPQTQLPEAALAAFQDLPPQTQLKGVISQQSLVEPAEKTTVSKIETDRRNNSNRQIPFEPPANYRGNFESHSFEFNPQKIVQPPVKLSSAQVENRSDSVSNRNSNAATETAGQVLFNTDNQHTIRELSSADSDFTGAAADTDSAANLRGQIEGAIRTSYHANKGQIVIRLNPPELGKIAVKFQEQSDNVTGIIHVDKFETKRQIQQALPELIQNLQNSGVRIKSIDVVVTNQQQQDSHGQSAAGQDNWSGQQSSPNQNWQRNSYDQWRADVGSIAEIMEREAKFFDGSINILA